MNVDKEKYVQFGDKEYSYSSGSETCANIAQCFINLCVLGCPAAIFMVRLLLPGMLMPGIYRYSLSAH